MSPNVTRPVAPPRPGDPRSLAGYRVAGRLGEGGQGTVFLAYGPDGRPVAIKTLHARFGADPKARARFAREIAAARRVAPFCTARVLTADVEGDAPYVVSEFIDGPTLQEFVRQCGPQDGAALERLAIGTLTALAAVHRAGIVHRDFKPGNVLLPPEGPRVVDFGIARVLDATSTLTSQAIGTPAYMAPEQLDGDPAGPATDMFAWGSTMVFAGTGRPPFGADSVAAVVAAILDDEPDLTGLTGPLRDIVASCLAKDPAARPGPANVLARLLGHAPAAGGPADGTRVAATRVLTELYDTTVPAAAQQGATAPGTAYPPVRPDPAETSGRRPSRRTVIGAGAVALTGALGGAFLLRSGDERVRWRYPVHDDEVTYMAATEDALFFAPFAGPLYALDAAAGRQRWRHDGTLDDLVLYGGSFFVAGDERVDAVDAATGRNRWSVPEPGKKIAVAGDLVVVAGGAAESGGRQQVTVSAMTGADGTRRWRRTISQPLDRLKTAAPVLMGSGKVVAVTLGMNVYALAAATGRVLWRYPMGGILHSPGVLAGDTILIGSPDVGQAFYAIDAATGKERWRAPSLVFGNAIAADAQTVYFGASPANYSIPSAGGLRALDIRTGQERWHRAGMGITETWGPVGGLVYGTDMADRQSLCALDAATGKTMWEEDRAGASVVAANAATAFLVAGGDKSRKNQTIYALRTGR